jgi:hypothetical protein
MARFGKSGVELKAVLPLPSSTLGICLILAAAFAPIALLWLLIGS